MTARRTRAGRALVAAALIAAALATTAAGAPSASGVSIAESADSHFPDMAFVVSLPQEQRLTASQLRVTENRDPVPDVSVTKPGAEKTGVVLLIDASDSMKGRPIAAAMAAARAFAARRNPGQQLALITFNSDTNVTLPLTTDAATISNALSQTPALANGTHIYDALTATRALLEQSGVSVGSVVLLSDGTDVGSRVDQKTAIASVSDAKIRIFAVGLRSGTYDREALRAIAEQTQGTYTEAAATSSLDQIFQKLGYTLSNEYVMHYRSLAGPDKNMRVALQVDGIPGTARTTYTSPPLPAAASAPGFTTWDRIVRSSITLILVVLAVVALLGLAAYRIVYRPDQALTRRIGQFVTLPEDEKAKQRQAEVEAALAPGERRPSHGRWQRLEDDVDLARISLTPRAIALLTVLGGLVLGVVVAILVGSPIGLLAGLVAPLVANSLIQRRLRKVRKTFSDQLPDNLDVLSSGLRSGHSFVGALAVCVDDAIEPSKTEFQRVISDEQLGIPIEESLHVVAQRMESRDVVQIALVAKLQRDAGTNAADVLDQVAYNVRARLELRRLITTLTAQGRMARWIVSLLPVFLFLAIYFLSDYLTPLWEDPIGIAALIGAAIMILIGSLVIKRIIEIEV